MTNIVFWSLLYLVSDLTFVSIIITILFSDSLTLRWMNAKKIVWIVVWIIQRFRRHRIRKKLFYKSSSMILMYVQYIRCNIFKFKKNTLNKIRNNDKTFINLLVCMFQYQDLFYTIIILISTVVFLIERNKKRTKSPMTVIECWEILRNNVKNMGSIITIFLLISCKIRFM